MIVDKKLALYQEQSMMNTKKILSVSQPLLEKAFPVNIQLRETKQTRRLENYKRYE